MAVYDRWHKSRPKPGEPVCREHGKVPTAEHGKGDRWQVRDRDDTRRQIKRNFAKQSDANAHDARVRASIAAGDYVSAAAGKVKFATYAGQWRAIQVHREATSALTERALRLYVNPVIGDLPLAMVRPAHVQQLVKQLADDLAPSTVAVVYGYVASVFKAAVRDRLIGRTPCERIRLPALPRRDPWIPEPAAVEAMAGFLPRWYRAVPLVAARAGLRPSELLGLEVECIDFLRRTIVVRQQLITSTGAGNVAYLAPPKTPQSDRAVPVTAATVDLLAAHLAGFPAAEIEVEDRTNPAEAGAPPGPAGVYDIAGRAGEAVHLGRGVGTGGPQGQVPAADRSACLSSPVCVGADPVRRVGQDGSAFDGAQQPHRHTQCVRAPVA
jgi:integrase